MKSFHLMRDARIVFVFCVHCGRYIDAYAAEIPAVFLTMNAIQWIKSRSKEQLIELSWCIWLDKPSLDQHRRLLRRIPLARSPFYEGSIEAEWKHWWRSHNFGWTHDKTLPIEISRTKLIKWNLQSNECLSNQLTRCRRFRGITKMNSFFCGFIYQICSKSFWWRICLQMKEQHHLRWQGYEGSSLL